MTMTQVSSHVVEIGKMLNSNILFPKKPLKLCILTGGTWWDKRVGLSIEVASFISDNEEAVKNWRL